MAACSLWCEVTKICEIEAHSSFQNLPSSTKICEIEAHSVFENRKRALALAHALRASHSGGSPWVEQTRHFVFMESSKDTFYATIIATVVVHYFFVWQSYCTHCT